MKVPARPSIGTSFHSGKGSSEARESDRLESGSGRTRDYKGRSHLHPRRMGATTWACREATPAAVRMRRGQGPSFVGATAQPCLPASIAGSHGMSPSLQDLARSFRQVLTPTIRLPARCQNDARIDLPSRNPKPGSSSHASTSPTRRNGTLAVRRSGTSVTVPDAAAEMIW
jgi:hypothetical protein